MILVTRDIHGSLDISKFNTKNFPQQKNMTKNDYVVVCGDFGLVWDNSNEDKYWREWLNEKSFTTLFVDGNHEGYTLLNQYSIEQWNRGKIHKIMPSIYHLMRGQVFEIENKKIFTMGGATSHDKESRKENASWWKEELPSDEEYEEAIKNLTKHNWEVDYIISHCCASSTQKQIRDYYGHDKLTNFFEYIIKDDCKYKKWFFGHYHEDLEIDEKHICLYDRIIEID